MSIRYFLYNTPTCIDSSGIKTKCSWKPNAGSKYPQFAEQVYSILSHLKGYENRNDRYALKIRFMKEIWSFSSLNRPTYHRFSRIARSFLKWKLSICITKSTWKKWQICNVVWKFYIKKYKYFLLINLS